MKSTWDKETHLTADQMLLLRIAATMAWADDNVAPIQQEVILDRLSQKFAHDPTQQADVRSDLKTLMARAILLEDLVPQLTTTALKEQALMLSYEVISSNQINETEAVVYQKLLNLLNLPPKPS
ncbi:MAG: TerB family tellurite resistance protein, partial [Leptolyngbyaceae cyanobacterium SM2_5_2]|nr:TerB family tellurite resistance protein [Leptolyngbyaceae cyanobacterium SM2_5_2]